MGITTTKVGKYFINTGLDDQGNFIIELPYKAKLQLFDNGDIILESKNAVIVNSGDSKLSISKNIEIDTSSITTNVENDVSMNCNNMNYNIETINIINQNKDNLITTLTNIVNELLVVVDDLSTTVGVTPDLSIVNSELDKLKTFTIANN